MERYNFDVSVTVPGRKPETLSVGVAPLETPEQWEIDGGFATQADLEAAELHVKDEFKQNLIQAVQDRFGVAEYAPGMQFSVQPNYEDEIKSKIFKGFGQLNDDYMRQVDFLMAGSEEFPNAVNRGLPFYPDGIDYWEGYIASEIDLRKDTYELVKEALSEIDHDLKNGKAMGQVGFTLTAEKDGVSHSTAIDVREIRDWEYRSQKRYDVAQSVKTSAYDLIREKFGRSVDGVVLSVRMDLPVDTPGYDFHFEKARDTLDVVKSAVKETNNELDSLSAKKELSPWVKENGINGVSHKTLSDPRFKGMALQGYRTQVFFPHYDRVGLTGMSEHDQVIDSKGVWHSNVKKSDTKLVLCERPIDALSYHQVKGDPNTRYMAIGERLNESSKELIRSAVQKMSLRGRIIDALENDGVGRGLLEEIGREIPGVNILRDAPEHGRWNDKLRQLQRQVDRFPGFTARAVGMCR